MTTLAQAQQRTRDMLTRAFTDAGADPGAASKAAAAIVDKASTMIGPDTAAGAWNEEKHHRKGKGKGGGEFTSSPGPAGTHISRREAQGLAEVFTQPGHGKAKGKKGNHGDHAVSGPFGKHISKSEARGIAEMFGPHHQPKPVEPITAAEARDGSRPVSAGEFQALAAAGAAELRRFRADRAPITGLDQDWAKIKQDTYDQARKSWGGATIDAHTGIPLATDADKYALSVKKAGQRTVSVGEDATFEQFSQAMDRARAQFRDTLESGQSYLGVFHDDENNRIDIDPVTVVDTVREVETIGAYTHAIGGAYHFKSGDGVWPPHVAETADVAAAAAGKPVRWAGPGQWRSNADEVQPGLSEEQDAEITPDADPKASDRLYGWSADGDLLGTIDLDGTIITGGDPGLAILAAEIAEDAGDTLHVLDGWTDGDLLITQAGVWDERKHPRGHGGKFAPKTGVGLSAVNKRPSQKRFAQLVGEGHPLMEALRMVSEEIGPSGVLPQSRRFGRPSRDPGTDKDTPTVRAHPDTALRDKLNEWQAGERNADAKHALNEAQRAVGDHDWAAAARQLHVAAEVADQIKDIRPYWDMAQQMDMRGRPLNGRLKGQKWSFKSEPAIGDQVADNWDQRGHIAYTAADGKQQWAGAAFDDGRVMIIDVTGRKQRDAWFAGNANAEQDKAWQRLQHGLLPYPPEPPRSPAGDMVAPGVKQYVLPGMKTRRSTTAAKVTAKLDAALKADHEKDKKPGQDLTFEQPEGYNYFGNSADTDIVTFADGTKWVRKRGLGNGEMNTELAVSRVADAIGITDSPQVVKLDDPATGQPEIYEPFVPNAVTAIEWTGGYDPDVESDDYDGGSPDAEPDHTPDEMYDTPGGHLLGLLDMITDGADRHMGNWMVADDPDGGHPVPIDNGGADLAAGLGSDSPFAANLDLAELADEHPSEEWDRWEANLEALRPEFADLGISGELDNVLGNLAEVREQAGV